MSIDILVITYRWAHYAQRSLEALLDTCDDSMRVWLWHNGVDEETLATARSFRTHPRVAAFHHSLENQKLRTPTNWMWSQAGGDYVSKVDDDCLVASDWADKLRKAHEDEPRFGVIGSWRFYDEDFEPDLAGKKIATFRGGHKVMRNAWVQGSGYLMKRRCVEEQGLLRKNQSFTDYCVEVAHRGYVNGWYYPFVHEEHLDDPRSPMTGLHSDADLLDRLPLSAQQRGITTLADWEARMRASAKSLQAADPDPRQYRRGHRRLQRLLSRMARRR